MGPRWTGVDFFVDQAGYLERVRTLRSFAFLLTSDTAA